MEGEQNNNISTIKSEEIKTYIMIGLPETGKLELDLVTARAKNEEIRYLSITFSGLNLLTGQPQDAFLNIDNEEAFNELKKFFAQLQWNS